MPSWGRNNICVTTSLRVGQPRNRGPIPDWGTRFFASPKPSDRPWSLSSLLFNGYRRLFSQEQSGRDVKLTTLFSFEVKNTWSHASTPPYVFMECTGITTFYRLCCLFYCSDFCNCSDYEVSNVRITVNIKLEKIWKERLWLNLRLLFLHFPGGPWGNYEKSVRMVVDVSA